MKHWRSATAIAASLTVASGAAALVLAALSRDIALFPLSFLAIAAVATCLGLPTYAAARSAGNDTPLTAAVIGFLVGAILPALAVLGNPADQASIGETATIVNGRHTLAGWWEGVQNVALFGVLGAAAGILFLALVGRRRTDDAERTDALPPSLKRTSSLSVAAIGLLTLAHVIPDLTADKSCHNPLRNGGDSIAQAAGFDLRVATDQWRGVEDELRKFQRAGNWAMRGDVRTDPSFPWMQISLCKEAGTNIRVQGLADFGSVRVGLFQPQGGDTWQADFRALHDRLAARWPGRIRYQDDQGREVGLPAWLDTHGPK